MEGVHVVGGRARGSGDGSPPVVSRGKAPAGGLGDSPPEAEAKYEISIQFLTFPVQNLGFDEYTIRAWAVYFADKQFKKNSEDSMGVCTP